MNKCDRFRELISLYIDDMLDEKEKLELEEHLQGCEDCKNELEEIKQLVNSCREMEVKEPPEYLTPLIMNSVRKDALKTGLLNRIIKKANPKVISVAAAALLLFAVITSGVLPHLGHRISMKSEDSAQSLPQVNEEYQMADNAEMEYDRGSEGKVKMNMAAGENGLMMEKQEVGNRDGSIDKSMKTSEAPVPEQNRKVIKNADISLEVESFDAGFDSLINIVETLGGYVQNSDSYTRKIGSGENVREFKEGHAVLKIPAVKFNRAVEDIAVIGRVTRRSVSGSDVTLEYMDIQARLESKQAQEKRLLEILDKASKLEDILRIENELNRVRTDIEMYVSRLNNWDNLVQYSTIMVSMREVEPKDKEVIPPIMGNLWERIRKAFIVTTNGIIDLIEYVIVGIGYALPVIIICGSGLIVWRIVKNRRKGGI